MTENWYIILELEFDPNPVTDQSAIDARIEEKSKFWSSKFNDFNKGPEYRKYHQMLPEIKKAMNDPEERKRLIKEACDITYSQIDKYVKMAGRKGEITNDEIQNIANRLKFKYGTVKNRVLTLGVKIGETKTASYQSVYDKYYKYQPKNASLFNGMKSMLSSFGVDNLYDFLTLGTTTKRIESSPCDVLRQMAKDKKKNEFNKTDAKSGSGSKICGQCDITFKDDANKAEYDNYLEYIRRRAILDEVKEQFVISGELSEEHGEDFIGQLTQIFKDRKLANEVLIAFCKIEKIPYNPKNSGETAKKLIICRICGVTNDATDEKRKVCQNCGEELHIKCPKCGTSNESDVKVCKCGFKQENIDKATALCNLAETAINNMDFAVAEAHLADAEKYYPGSGKVDTLRKQLSDSKKRVGTAAETMRTAVSEKRYYEANKLFANIKKLFPEFKEPDLENEIKNALNSASAALKQAQAAKVEKDIIDYCVKAYEACKDYPGVMELIPSPTAPSNLKTAVDGNTRTINLSWDKSDTVGTIYYIITRKKDAAPINVNDGEILGKVSACNFTDNKPEPATSYFYAVFSERVGAHSKPLVNDSPVIILFEISNLTVTAGNEQLQLEWDALPKGATVEIYRRSGTNKEELVKSTTSISHLDSELKNDNLYTYIVKLIYIVNGKRQLTSGTIVNGVPTKPPNPIESLSVKPGDGDSFNAEWSNPDNATVELYCSAERPTYNYGDLISQQVIEKKMRRLALNRTSNTTATFLHKSNELLYIAACVIKSGSVIFGEVARASKGETVKIQKIAAVNDKINIYLEPPKDSTGFVVLYSFDKFPSDIGDVKTIRRYIPLKQYLHNSALVIDTLEQKNYFFSVFAEFTRDGEKDYSIGADYLFYNASKEIITYSIVVSKKLFGENAVILEFESGSKSFELPDIEIMSGNGVAPMFKSSSKLFYSIPKQSVNGILQIKIPISKDLPRDTFIKAFLKDEALVSRFQLKLKLKSNYKIS